MWTSQGAGWTYSLPPASQRLVAAACSALVAGARRPQLGVPAQVLQGVQRQLELRLPEVRGLAVLPISGLTEEGTQELLPAAVRLFQTWSRRVPTARLNRWLVAVRLPAAAAP